MALHELRARIEEQCRGRAWGPVVEEEAGTRERGPAEQEEDNARQKPAAWSSRARITACLSLDQRSYLTF